jgi:membrane protein YqaA with SNARE-associated domain
MGRRLDGPAARTQLARTPFARMTFARLQRLASGRSGIALVAAWAFLEAIVFPVVPDVGLGLLVLVAPRRTFRLFASVVIAGLAGSAVLYVLSLAAPDAVRSMLLALPGIREPVLAAAHDAVASGDPRSIALFGPGTPLKVFTFAWAVGPGTPIALAAGVVLNRLTRIGPGLVCLAVAGWLMPGFLRRHDRLVLAAYALFFLVLYAIYWQ